MNTNLPGQHSNFLLYTGKEGKISVEVFLKEETIWLTQKAIGELFNRERSVITKHLKHIFSTGELEEKSNVQKMHFSHSSHSDKPILFLLPNSKLTQLFFLFLQDSFKLSLIASIYPSKSPHQQSQKAPPTTRIFLCITRINIYFLCKAETCQMINR